MSNLTGTVQELLYLSQTPGAAKNTFTTEVAINDTATMGVQAELPANFWLPNQNQQGRAVLLKALVSLGSTGTPTFTPVVRLGTAGSITGPIVATSAAALTTVSGAASLIRMEIILQMITRAANGANSTVRGQGWYSSPGFAIPQGMLWGASSAASGVTPGAVATVDPSIDNYVNLNFICGTSNAANQVQCMQLEMHGLN